jgi:hypothetical protein
MPEMRALRLVSGRGAANVAVMRKLLHSIRGMLKHDRDFEDEKFYALGA